MELGAWVVSIAVAGLFLAFVALWVWSNKEVAAAFMGLAAVPMLFLGILVSVYQFRNRRTERLAREARAKAKVEEEEAKLKGKKKKKALPKGA